MSTARYELPTVPENSTNPATPVNNSLLRIDALIDTVVQDMSLTAPPTTVDADIGKVWIPAATATGAWAGHEDELAIATGADAWLFLVTPEAKKAHNLDDGNDYVFDSGAWTLYGGAGVSSVNGSTGAVVLPAFAQLMLSDMTTDLTTGTAKAVWFAPEPGVLADVWIALHDPSSSGVVRIDMNDSGGSVFTTRPSIDATEPTSLTGTAAVLDGTVSFAKGDKFTFDIDDAGTDAKGLQAVVEYTPT